jgi:hypothetical protein
MGRSLRVTIRRGFTGNTSACPVQKSARHPTQLELVLDLRITGDVGVTQPQSLVLLANRVVE